MIGRLTGGVVIAVRPIDATQDAALTNSILSALGQDQITVSAVYEEEIVILRADQTAASIVEPTRSASSDYVPGQKIAIVEAAATMIHPE